MVTITGMMKLTKRNRTVISDQLHVDKAAVQNNTVQLVLQNDRRNLTVEFLQWKCIP